MAWPATCYIDYQDGDDSYNGLTKTTAWKHCPGMRTAADSAGRYRGRAGDVFIFKGGVIWQHAAADTMFPLEVTYTSGWQNGTRTAPVTFRCDSTWYADASFTCPVFDGNGTAKRLFSLNYNDWFIVDGFDLRNHGGNGYGDGGIMLYESDHSVVRNCHVHDWRRTGTTDGKYGGIIVQASDTALIDNCHIHGDSSGNCGIAILENSCVDPEIRNCVIHNVPNGILGGGQIHHCRIFDINGSFDPTMHENGIETFSDCAVYNNIIYDVAEGVTVYLAASFSGVPGTGYFYNNLVYGCTPIPLRLDPDSAVYHVYNNTLVHNGSCIVAVERPTYDPLRAVYIKNNVLVNTGSGYGGAIGFGTQKNHFYDIDYNCYYIKNDTGHTVWGHDSLGQMTLAQARSHGFDLRSMAVDPQLDTNTFRLLSALSPVAGAGADLVQFFSDDLDGLPRPQGSLWDLGAYEYPVTGIAAKPHMTSAVKMTVSAGTYDLRGRYCGRSSASPRLPSGIYFTHDAQTGCWRKIVFTH
jgi:hypothetical protein